MRKIKSYIEFGKINESLGFGKSHEYNELSTLFSKTDWDELKEHFYDLTDDNIVTASTWKFIGDDDGQSIGWSQSVPNLSANHSVYYGIRLDTHKSVNLLDVGNSINNLKKIGSNLSKISDSIESFKGKMGEGNVKVKIEEMISGKRNSLSINIIVKGEPIDKHTFETFYKKWKNNYGPKYDEGLKYLVGEYQNAGINNPPLDTNDIGDIIHIGFFTEDEVIVVADYHKKDDEFDFDWEEVKRSIKEWRLENPNNPFEE